MAKIGKRAVHEIGRKGSFKKKNQIVKIENEGQLGPKHSER